MPTSALSVRRLADLMRDAAARTFHPESRFAGETDEVLLGKLTQLDVLADAVWTGGELTDSETADLQAAGIAMGRAWDHLKIVTARRHLDAKPHNAALQCERHARHHESVGGEAGKAKAAGYRHAVHVFRILGALPLPAFDELRRRELPPGELFPDLP